MQLVFLEQTEQRIYICTKESIPEQTMSKSSPTSYNPVSMNLISTETTSGWVFVGHMHVFSSQKSLSPYRSKDKL